MKKIEAAIISPFCQIPPSKGGGIEMGIFRSVPFFKNVNFTIFSQQYDDLKLHLISGDNAQYVQFPLHGKLYRVQKAWNICLAKKFFFSLYDYPLTRQIVSYIRRTPDIIEVRNNFYYIPYLKKKFPKSAFVLKMHNEFLFEYPFLTKQYKKIIDLADKIITVSAYLKDRITEHYPQSASKIEVIHNAVSLSIFKKLSSSDPQVLKWKEKLNLPSSNKIFIFVGRINQEKGVEVLVNAFKAVLLKHPDAQLLIVGTSWFADGDMTPYVKKVHDISRSFADNIRFTGFIGHEELNYLYNLASICVIPSVWQEPFGLINLEAMAAGCAVIASRVGGIPEIVKHGETGLLVEPANAHELSSKMIYLLEHPDQREHLVANGLAYVQKHGGWDIVAQKTEEIYHRITKK